MKAKASSATKKSQGDEFENGRHSDSAGIIILPPVIFVSVLLLGFGLHLLWPASPLDALLFRIAGVVLVLASVALARWAELSMQRAGTNIRPDRPTTAIVTNGPFRYTRNPLYVACTGAYLGITLLVNALWPLVLLVPLLALVHWGIVRREERYLEKKFGEPYCAYKAQVRRWL